MTEPTPGVWTEPAAALPAEAKPDENGAYEALKFVLALSLVGAVIGVAIGLTADVPLAASIGGVLFGVAFQVWIIMLAFRAWRQESRQQTAAFTYHLYAARRQQH